MNTITSGQPLEIVVFEAAGQTFGVRSIHVREIVRAATLSAAPQAHPAILGILNLRGQVVAVYDLRNLLEAPAAPLAHTDHLIVTQAGGHWLALRADRAVELVRVPSESMVSAEGIIQNWNAILGVAKIAGRLVLVVEPEELWARCGRPAMAEPSPATSSTGQP